MKNVTITLDDETARWVRVEAERRGASVSRLVGDYLRDLRGSETACRAAAERFLGRGSATLKPADARYPGRAELHDR